MEMFEKALGTTDMGRLGTDYEDRLLTYYSVILSLNPHVDDFKMSSNNKDFGNFDDIVMEVIYKDRQVHRQALQLKYKTGKDAVISPEQCMNLKGDFSLCKYFEQYKKVSKLHSFDLRILTNGYFSLKKRRLFNMENEQRFAIEIVEAESPMEFIQTSRNTFKFLIKRNEVQLSEEDENEIKILETFLKSYYLHSSQSNLNELEEKIKNFFFGEETYKHYVEFIVKWSFQTGRKFKLTKETCVFKIAECLLTPYILVPNQNFSLPEEMLRNFDVIICRTQVVFSEEDVTDWVITKRFGLSDADKTKILWHSCKIPLTIKPSSEIVYKAIDLCKFGNGRRKFILIEGDRSKLDGFKILENSLDLLNFDQSFLEQFKVRIEGRKLCSLNEFLEGDEDLAKLFDFDEIIRMYNNTFVIDEKCEQLPTPYISRFFPKKFISPKILRELPEKQLLVVSCNKSKLTSLKTANLREYHALSVNKKREIQIIVNEELCSPEELARICLDNATRNVHHLCYTSGGNLEWLSSKEGIEILRKFLVEHSEEPWIKDEGLQHFGTNLVCADPGMGKTVLMTFLRESCPANLCPIKINLREHYRFFKQHRTVDDVLEYLLKTVSHPLARKIFQAMNKKKRILFLWDGMDELPDNCMDSAVKTINLLCKEGFPQWVVGRCHLKDQLEIDLGVFSKSMTQFSEEEQRNYVSLRLDIPKNNTKIERVIKSVNSSRSQEILGIPLQIYMLTEIFDEEDFCQDLLLTDIYLKFVQKKFRFFICKVKEIDFLALEMEKHMMESLKKNYQRAGLINCFREMMERFSSEPEDDFLIKIKKDGDRRGFIVQIDSNRIPFFAHQTYGEFFSAWYLQENWRSIDKAALMEFMLEDRFQTIKYMLDMLLANRNQAHLAVLYRDVDLLAKSNFEILDLGGRSPLQLACACGEKLRFFNCQPDEIQHEISKEDLEKKLEIDPVSKTLLTLLIESDDYFRKDDLLHLNFFEYCDRFSTLLPLEILSEISDERIKHEIKKSRLFKNHLYVFYCVRLNYHKLFSLVDYIPFIFCNYEFDDSCEANTFYVGPMVQIVTLLHLSAQYGNHPSILSKILNRREYYRHITTGPRTPLYLASENGHLDTVEILWKSGAVIEHNQRTSLHVAAENEHLNIVSFFLENRVDANSTDVSNMNSLHYACDLPKNWKNGNSEIRLEIAKKLVLFGASTNSHLKSAFTSAGPTALHFATKNGFEAVVKFLIDQGVAFNIRELGGYTPFRYAIEKGHMSIAEYLFKLGADVNLPVSNGRTPLMWAAEEGNTSVVEFLLKRGADVNKKNNNQLTALHFAIKESREDIAKSLLDHGADVNEMDLEMWRTPLHWAVQNFNLSFVKFLVEEKSAEICNSTDKSGETFLYTAMRLGKVDIAQYLIQCGAKADSEFLLLASERGHDIVKTWIKNETNLNKGLALCNALKNGHESIAKFLIENGADLNVVDKLGRTPLHWAIYRGLEFMVFLVSNGAKVTNDPDKEGKTLLDTALAAKNESIAMYLIENGANFDDFDVKEMKPIHWAAKLNFSDLLYCLLGKNVDVDSIDSKERTPLYYALKGNNSTAEILKSSGANEDLVLSETLLNDSVDSDEEFPWELF